MFTQKELDLLKGFAKDCADYCWFPFDWKNGILYPTKSRIKYILVFLNFLVSCAQFAYITLRFSTKFGGGLSAISFPYHVFAFLLHILFISFHVHMFKYTEEVSLLFNQLVFFHREQGITYLHMTVLPPNRREIVLRFLTRWIYGATASFLVIYAFQPNNAYFVYSLVPKQHQTIWLQLLFSPLEAYFVACKVNVFHLLVVFFGLFYIATTNFWIHKICVEWSSSHQQRHHINSSFKLYRCLTLLNILYNTSFACFVVPVLKTLIESVFVVCIYGSIRLYELPLQMYIMFPAISSFLFVEEQISVDWMAMVHDISSQFHFKYSQSYFKLAKEGNIRRTIAYSDRFIKSCRPLRCQLTKVLFVEKATRLVLLDMLLNLVVTLLVSDNST